MPITNTDAVLHYDVGEFGKAGYAVPNWSDDVGSLNPQILIPSQFFCKSA